MSSIDIRSTREKLESSLSINNRILEESKAKCDSKILDAATDQLSTLEDLVDMLGRHPATRRQLFRDLWGNPYTKTFQESYRSSLQEQVPSEIVGDYGTVLPKKCPETTEGKDTLLIDISNAVVKLWYRKVYTLAAEANFDAVSQLEESTTVNTGDTSNTFQEASMAQSAEGGTSGEIFSVRMGSNDGAAASGLHCEPSEMDTKIIGSNLASTGKLSRYVPKIRLLLRRHTGSLRAN